ncbi:MAG TPA: hypothetical protein VG711_13075 [Phycisphaerales bacterium]|nr:hypothetical protein [Phycisphaerales bacterium]
MELHLPVRDARRHNMIAAQRALRLVEPKSANQLHAYVKFVLGFDVPRDKREGASGSTPFAYLRHSFFEEREAGAPADCVVWANRGGGKTQMGAVATLLDLLFKPGIEVRILAGSFEQSGKMYRYLSQMLETDVFSDLIAGQLTGRHVELKNGSRVEVLSQSQCAIRGQRVHKLRCDEVDLFEPEVWEAAQLTTRSGMCGHVDVQASVEALSTMHRPGGLMNRLVREAADGKRVLVKWNLMDVLATCDPARACEGCILWQECGGSAKTMSGFLRVSDAMQQKARVSEATWKAEMLCQQPSRTDCVYPEFEQEIHVVRVNSGAETAVVLPMSEDSPKRRKKLLLEHGAETKPVWLGGLDFGFRNPTVFLLARWDVEADVIEVVDELIRTGVRSEEFIVQAHELIKTWKARAGEVRVGADPAGHSRNEHTGVSTISLWKNAGFNIRTNSQSIDAGIGSIRRRLKRADGQIGLRVHERCDQLIQAMLAYHYDAHDDQESSPVKDGPDHCCDALRYMVVNAEGRGVKEACRSY